MPKRIQRQRSKGWRMPENAVYVGRPTKWGNPYRVDGKYVKGRARKTVDEDLRLYVARTAVLRYREAIEEGNPIIKFSIDDIRKELGGKDLVCWCPLDQTCHADVLLKIANAEVSPGVCSQGYNMGV